MSNMMFIMVESGMKAAAKKEKKEPSMFRAGLMTFISMSSLLFFVVCLLGALPYVFM